MIAELFPDETVAAGDTESPSCMLSGILDPPEKSRRFSQAAKIERQSGLSLADDLFRARPSAAMTRLMEGRAMSREAAATLCRKTAYRNGISRRGRSRNYRLAADEVARKDDD